MKINFKELRKQKIDFETILNILEAIQNSINEKVNNVKINELCFAEKIGIDKYKINMSFEPNSINDIFIIGRREQFVLTPDSIESIEKNNIIVVDKRLRDKEELFITYKY